MKQDFDVYDLFETPTFVLCNPNREKLFTLGTIKDRKYSPRYNALSEVSFTAPYSVSGSLTEYYDYLTSRRLIYLEDIGYFVIRDVSEEVDGTNKIKTVTASSAEYEFMNKKLANFSGTYKFYDLIDPAGTFMAEILQYVPGWTIGYVAVGVINRYRHFDITDTTLYTLLMQDAEQAFQCIFVFDTLNRTISIYDTITVGTQTDIVISYDNLLKNTKTEEITDEMVTALYVRGDGDLSINTVNPLGTNIIYNYTYYKTLSWMSQDLIDKLTVWENKVFVNQPTYADLLTSLKNANEELIVLNSELVDLNSELTSLINIRDVRIQQGGIDLSDINALINQKEAEISSKEAEISSKQATITEIRTQLTDINEDLSFENNFSAVELQTLSAYTFENSYINENFIQTDSMTNAEIQTQAQNLYDQAVAVLGRISQPRYQIEVDAVNFVFLKEYLPFTRQLELGASFNLELLDGTIIQPILLGMDIDYDNPEDFKLIFSNRYRLDDGAFRYSDLFSNTVKQSTTTKVNSTLWSSRGQYVQDTVSVFINSSLDASRNNIISGSNQNILIDSNGLLGRQVLSDGTSYNPEQVKLINNMLAFTRDGWNSASLAIGKISMPSGSAYGVVGDVIVGRLLAGNQLTISNSGGHFVLDENGATLTNATFNLNTTNGNSRILLDPTNGIKIQGNAGGTWVDKIYLDGTGEANFAGKLVAASGTFSGAIYANSGTIGGLSISASGLAYDNNHYIASNGNLKWGALSIQGNTATFTGTIYASKLVEQVVDNQIASVKADKITAGTIQGSILSGGRIIWPAGNIESYNGYTIINGTVGTAIQADGANCLTLTPGFSIFNTDLQVTGEVSFDSPVNFYSTIYVNGNLGTTVSVPFARYGGGYAVCTFRSGILTGITLG